MVLNVLPPLVLAAPALQAGQVSQKAVLYQVTTVQTHFVQQCDVLQGLTLTLSKRGAAGARLDGALLGCLRAAGRGGHD